MGVATVTMDTTSEELAILDEGNTRAARFTSIDYLGGESTKPKDIVTISGRLPERWHVVIYFFMRDFQSKAPLIEKLTDSGRYVLIDHMGRVDQDNPDDPQLPHFLDMLAKNERVYVKGLSPERNTKVGYPYDDYVGIARQLGSGLN